MAHINFSTDSASDIPAALREEWNIQVLPFPIAMGDREYMDGFDFTPDEFFQMLLDSPQIPTPQRTHAEQPTPHSRHNPHKTDITALIGVSKLRTAHNRIFPDNFW